MRSPRPWKKYDGNVLSGVSVRLGSASHIARGPGQRRAAWGPAGEAGRAGQQPQDLGWPGFDRQLRLEQLTQRNKLGVLLSPPATHAATWGAWVWGAA